MKQYSRLHFRFEQSVFRDRKFMVCEVQWFTMQPGLRLGRACTNHKFPVTVHGIDVSKVMQSTVRMELDVQDKIPQFVSVFHLSS